MKITNLPEFRMSDKVKKQLNTERNDISLETE